MRFFLLFIASLLLLSCQDIEEVGRPANLIPEQKMVDVLTDLSLLNSAKNYNKRFLEQTGLKPSEYLFQKYNIDSLQLASSTQYYARNYSTFENIYQKVQRNLEAMKNDLDIIVEEEERIKDSLRLINGDSIRLIDGDSIRVDSINFRAINRDSLIPFTPNYEEEKS